MQNCITCNCSCPYSLLILIASTILEFADLEFIEPVGSGGSGHVWKGHWKSRDMTVAIKKVIDLPEREVRKSLAHLRSNAYSHF